jgi:biopolymer transport protein ExbD
MRRKRHTPQAAMTDIAFILLLFFLIISITTTLLPISLKEATATETTATEQKGPVIVIGKGGDIYQDNIQITRDQLPSTAEEVSVVADRDTPFSAIAPVIKKLQQNGTKHLHCIVEEEK